jgi:hypothetical protein
MEFFFSVLTKRRVSLSPAAARISMVYMINAGYAGVNSRILKAGP